MKPWSKSESKACTPCPTSAPTPSKGQRNGFSKPKPSPTPVRPDPIPDPAGSRGDLDFLESPNAPRKASAASKPPQSWPWPNGYGQGSPPESPPPNVEQLSGHSVQFSTQVQPSAPRRCWTPNWKPGAIRAPGPVSLTCSSTPARKSPPRADASWTAPCHRPGPSAWMATAPHPGL